ncbi:MAG: DnaB-like helicase C-terminal domain-containing protein [Nanoarchaeota archaeon]
MRNKRENRNKVDVTSLIYGKIPPQAKELEEDILGIALLEPNQISEIRQIISIDDFYVSANQIIYKNLLQLDSLNIKGDLRTVAEQLKNNGELELIGGPYYLTNLINGVVSSANILTYCRLIKQYSIARQLIQISGEVISMSYESIDPFEILNYCEQKFYNINSEIEQIGDRRLDILAVDFANSLFDEKSQIEKVYTGIKEWDNINGSLFPGGIFIVAGRPGMGKTAFVVELLSRMAKNYFVGLINREMTNNQMVQRIVSNTQRIDNYIFKKNSDDYTESEKTGIFRGMHEFINLKLEIDSKSIYIDRIVAKIKYWVRKCGVKVIVIDFLQMVKVPQDMERYMTEVQKIDYVLDQLTICAKDVNVPFILLCQLNRELYKRGNKEPTMSDLKGSGKIEEMAYQISFLHRPEYYLTTGEAIVDEFGEDVKGLCYQIIAKHRDGHLGRIKHRFIPQFSKFEDWNNPFVWQPTTNTEF